MYISVSVFVIACSSIGQYLSVNLFMSGPMLTSTMLPMLSTQNLASADSRFRSGEQSLLDNYFSFKLPIKYFIKYIFSGFALLFGFDFFIWIVYVFQIKLYIDPEMRYS
jgi:hypothetical protein